MWSEVIVESMMDDEECPNHGMGDGMEGYINFGSLRSIDRYLTFLTHS